MKTSLTQIVVYPMYFYLILEMEHEAKLKLV